MSRGWCVFALLSEGSRCSLRSDMLRRRRCDRETKGDADVMDGVGHLASSFDGGRSGLAPGGRFLRGGESPKGVTRYCLGMATPSRKPRVNLPSSLVVVNCTL